MGVYGLAYGGPAGVYGAVYEYAEPAFVIPDDDDGCLAPTRNRVVSAVPRTLAVSALSRNRTAAVKGRR